MKQGLDPIINEQSKTLILGTMPGDDSLRLKQYYSHPRNQFWHIIFTMDGKQVADSYEERVSFLKAKNLAVWDVLRVAVRKGSLDSAIRNGVANDFGEFFSNYPNLRTIAFNGGRAKEIFSEVLAQQKLPCLASVQIVLLPSTSPTPGRHVLAVAEKAARWKALLGC